MSYSFKGLQLLTPYWPTFAGMLDGVSGLVHAWSPACRLLTSYTGNLVLLRRVSDDAQQAFGPSSNGELNAAAVTAWAAGSNVFVVTVYDQVGSTNPTQAVAGSQPQLVLNAKNGRAAQYHDGTADYLQAAYGAALSQPFHLYTVAQLDAIVVNDTATHYMTDGDDVAGRMIVGQYNLPNPDTFSLFGGTFWLNGPASDANWHQFTGLYNGAACDLRIDAASVVTGNSGVHNADGITIGASFAGVSLWKGYIGAVIIADPSHSDAQRNVVEGNLATYWGL